MDAIREAIQQFILNLFGGWFLAEEFCVLICSMLPIIELRGSIPVGAAIGLPFYLNYLLSILGNMLASLCNMSEVLFRRNFKNSTGLSPLKYINNLKISRAKELLSVGMCSVSEAATLSGFHNECYFSREFKKHTGMSPVEYKKNSN